MVALQISTDSINKVMAERSGMGTAGESYLVGADYLMRSDSFLDPINHSVEASFANPEKGSIDSDTTKAALAGKVDRVLLLTTMVTSFFRHIPLLIY